MWTWISIASFSLVKKQFIYLWLVCVDVWQKPSQYFKVIILQLKKKRNKSGRETYWDVLAVDWPYAAAGYSTQTVSAMWTLSQIRSDQISHSVVSDSLRPHESQHARPPCPSPSPGVHSNSRSSSWWCHPAISSSVVAFSSCPQSLPASESFPMSQLFSWGGQSTGVSAL